MSVDALVRGTGARPEPADRELRAGGLTALLRGVDLAHVRLGELPLLRLVYGAVRDEAWGTVEPVVSDLAVEDGDHDFVATFTVTHAGDELEFGWRGRIAGTADGTITYELDGTSPRDCTYTRIGLCVLHPLLPTAGSPFRAWHDGRLVEGTFPTAIAPQPFIDGCYTPAIAPFTELELDLAPGLTLRLAFEGDEFEVEDQRNWTDATFKTYSTPLHLGFPHGLAAGARLRQVLTLTTSAGATAAALPRGGRARAEEPVELELLGGRGPAVPPLGAVWPRGGAAPAGTADERQALGLAHVRVELDLEAGVVAPAPGLALPPGVELELALWASAASAPAAVAAVRAATAIAPVARVLVLAADADVLDPGVAAAVRAALHEAGLRVPVGGGSDYWFAEIHRSPADLRDLDLLCFSITPQLHTFDDESIFESLAIQPQVVEAGRARVASGRVAVSPVTLAPRDPDAVRAGAAPPAEPRQHGLLAAAWTAASVGALAEAGVESATYFDLAGPAGLLGADGAGTPPVAHALAAAAALRGLALVPMRSGAPGRVRAWAADGGDLVHATVANCTPRPQRVTVTGLADGAEARVTVLDAATGRRALGRPPGAPLPFRSARAAHGRVGLELAPYAVGWLEIPAPKVCALS